MRNGMLWGARSVLLAGPVALAFFSGGYFDLARTRAALVAWALVLICAVAAERPLARSVPARIAVGALVAFAAWTLLSTLWTPLPGVAYHDGERVILYAGALIAACGLLRGRVALRAVEPVVAAGVLVVIGYGLSERLLPGLLTFTHSPSAGGRLEQPITYWNATGELAALGFVLCARLAGDATRSRGLRLAAAAAAAPLGLGLYVSFSRGALFACAAGLVALAVGAASRPQFRALVITTLAGGAAAAAGAGFHSVTTVYGKHATRVSDGAAALIVLVALAALAALAQWTLCRGELSGRRSVSGVRLPRGASALATLVVAGGFALFLAVGAKESTATPLSSGASRLTTLQSNRYEYWRVAERAFRAEPLRGVGGGGWSVYWLRYRTFKESAQDAHSLYIQTAAELGLVGLALLGSFLAAVAVCARRAHLRAPGMAAGLTAGFVVFAVHATLDWDWELPAVTLPALLLAGALVALSETERAAFS
ncbi:MAG: O-antigen ligase family protein [Solirubrobacteraceae bacterium]